MKEQIQQLISTGQTEEALQLLVKSAPDAILLQARYNQGKKQYNMGLIEFGEWSRIQAQVNYAALELAGSAKVTTSTAQTETSLSSSNSNSTSKKVFISYNHADRESADQIFDYLQKEGITAIIDVENMAIGDKIKDFILEQIKGDNAVLSLVSKNSLRSGWVGLESNLALYSQLLTNKKFIPVMIDGEVFNDEFYFDVIEEIETKTADLDKKMERARQLKVSYNQFETQRNRLVEQKNNLSKIIENFQNVLIADISNGNFQKGMGKVIKAIKG